jgi:hypothetical protein
MRIFSALAKPSTVPFRIREKLKYAIERKEAIMSEFTIPGLTTEQLNAMVKEMMRQMDIADPNEAVRRINSGEWIVETEKIRHRIIDFIGTIAIPARTEKFFVRKNFIVDTTETAKVKISGLSSKFKRLFYDTVVESYFESTMCFGRLMRFSTTESIIEELGGEKEARSTLSEMFACMEMQPNGEKGALHNNGYWNIFIILDISPWAFHCSWRDGGWFVSVVSYAEADKWVYECRVFSRNHPKQNSLTL